MVKAAAYSPSRLAVYQACARRYYYQYVVKAPRRQRAEASVGISLHGALEAIAEAGGYGAVGVEGALAHLAARWESAGFADAEHERLARASAETQLLDYLRKAESVPAHTLWVEKKLKGEFAGVPLVGIVDRLDRLPDGGLELIDYKSGRGALDLPFEVRQQLAIYRHLVKAQLGEYPAAIALHHLASSTRIAVDLSPAEWEATLETAVASVAALEADETFAPAVGPACSRCDYAHRCWTYQRTLEAASEAGEADEEHSPPA